MTDTTLIAQAVADSDMISHLRLRGEPESLQPPLPARPRFIFITGYKRSGKSTVASLIHQYFTLHCDQTVCIRPFMDIPRDRVPMLFGLPPELFYVDEFKDLPMDVWPYCSPRKLLLDVADTILARWPDIWVRQWCGLISNDVRARACILVPDLRMPLEYSVYKQFAAIPGLRCDLVRVMRVGQEAPQPGAHSTEAFIDTFEATETISNDHDIPYLNEQVQRLCSRLTSTSTGESYVQG